MLMLIMLVPSIFLTVTPDMYYGAISGSKMRLIPTWLQMMFLAFWPMIALILSAFIIFDPQNIRKPGLGLPSRRRWNLNH
ncbi:hypothetical protein H4P12_09065 [Paracoccus sp. 11-3]|uniref:Uncharacterized protein n=1 Tax=Paracoccus amoyensis TaxID=2760093 RepID=A0A926J634_9RHOB|nr:hypothetical protein [Paracoccus amoyensis]MBC9246862.1 hypothetical protein [Paracoccus amoyensis]